MTCIQEHGMENILSIQLDSRVNNRFE